MELIVGLVLIGVIVLVLIGIYNRLVGLRQTCRQGMADIDAQLRQRHDLIPNLVATVKGYAQHERDVLERVVALRNQAMANHGSPESQARDENALLGSMRSLFVVAEGYPQLKSDANFRSLQQELALTEDRIAAARRFFNGNVREFRNLKESFPTSIVGSNMRLEAASYFELDAANERVVPRIDLGR